MRPLALVRRRPPGMALLPVIGVLPLSICIAVTVRASAPQRLHNLGNILLPAHLLAVVLIMFQAPE